MGIWGLTTLGLKGMKLGENMPYIKCKSKFPNEGCERLNGWISRSLGHLVVYIDGIWWKN